MIPPPTIEQPVRDVLELERAGRVDDPRVVGDARAGGSRSSPAAMMQRSNETVVPPSAPSTRRTFGDVNFADAAHDLDLALLGEAVEAAGEARDDRLLPAAQAVEVDLAARRT